VFYDKGAFFDGWRYLEASTRDVGSGAAWSANDTRVRGTSTSAGSGKQNTELIVSALQETGENAAAAQVTTYYSQGGYDDWYLPSKDELDFLYKNLKQKNLGGFSGGYYWSSSQYDYRPGNAWCQRFSDGDQDYYEKKTTYSVRAIRAF
jgi:hypothetical protein